MSRTAQLENLATPALVIDLRIVDRNIARLASYAAAHKLKVRPHTKTHKSLAMAGRQMQAGALGLTAAKVGEAEVMAAAADDLLIAYLAIDDARRSHIAYLARGKRNVRVTVDSIEGIEAMAQSAREVDATVGILVDLDVGFHRTGAQTPNDALVLAQAVTRHASLRLDGLFFYPGHVWSPSDQQTPELSRIDGLLTEAITLWTRSGLSTAIVSGGSTPTAFQSHCVPTQTEIRPGTYIYNDMNTVRAGFCELEDCAAKLVCTVISTAVAGKAVIDAGTKALTSDRNVTAPDSGHGHVVEYPEARLTRLSEEHGELDVSECHGPPRLGDRVTVIPNHICPCVNLQDTIQLMDVDGSLHSSRVDTRGRLS